MARKISRKVPALNQQRPRRAATNDAQYGEFEVMPAQQRRVVEPLTAKSDKQKHYINAIKNFDVVFGLGCAGTGKTFIATVMACDLLTQGKIDKIIITRPAVEAGEEFGFLPGELSEKFEPYLAPLREIFYERLGKGPTEYFIKTGKIEAIPLAFMRGRSFRDCVVLFDEAQNATKAQFKMFLTRVGENCKVVIDGDAAQTDIQNSGLVDAANRVSHIPCVKIIQFGIQDVVRSGFVSEVIRAYDS